MSGFFSRHIPKLGLNDKLLLAFVAAALLTIIIAVISWLSFQEVVTSQRSIITGAIPASRTVQTLAISDSRINSIVPQFGEASSLQEYEQYYGLLREHVSRMKRLLGELESREFEPQLRSKLSQTVDSIDHNIEQQARIINRRLKLGQQGREMIGRQRSTTLELVTISESLVANASASITAHISNLYSVFDSDNGSGNEAYEALDQFIEVEIDHLERMSELQLTSFQLKALVEQLDDTSRAGLVAHIRSLFNANLKILQRRIKDINDPSRRENAHTLFQGLMQSVDVGGLFDTHLEYLKAVEEIGRLQQLGTQESVRLNEQASDLLKTVTETIDQAGLAAKNAVERGFAGFLAVAALLIVPLILTLWLLMRHHVIGRLRGMELAVNAISTGNLEVEIPVAGDDELARLAKALNRLRDNARERLRLESELLRSQRNLENQVEKRTSQLKYSNALLEKEVSEHALARDEAEKANQAKTTFLATMSHELRTPLSGVLGTLQLLGDSQPSKLQIEYIRMIRAANTTLLEILEDMLGYSKLESGKLDFTYTNLSVREVIDNILSLQGLRAQTKSIALIREIERNVPERITADRAKLNQILLNLIGNAIKYTDEGSVTLTVTSQLESATTDTFRLTFTISDTGIGIPESKYANVFNPFYQLNDTAHQHRGGTGLGLTICKKLAEAMGGEIWIEQGSKKGATISFYLICKSAPEETLADAEIISGSAVPPGRLLRVMIVEDDDINRRVCTHYLESLGHTCIEARDGLEALTQLQQQLEPVDVILMDIGLPGSSGTEVAVEIRALPDNRWEHVPIVAMSAHVFGETVEQYYAAGMIGFLSKPFDREQLSRALISAICTEQDKDRTDQAKEAQKKVQTDVEPPPLLDTQFIDAELDSLGDMVFKELLSLFEKEASDALENMRMNTQTQQWPEVSKRAHRLKGAAGNLGLSRSIGLAGQLEQIAMKRSVNIEEISDLLGMLEATLEITCAELKVRVANQQ